MKLGIIARRDRTGLGYQTKSYYDHLKPDKTLVIDLSPLNGNEQILDWYPGSPVVSVMPKERDLRQFLKDLDVVLTAESPYNYQLYTIAKEMGVKVANVINWEFFDHILHPEYPLPDLIIMPSTWYLEEAKKFANEHGIDCVYLHHPVDRQEIPFRLRTRSRMVHIAGKPAAHDRNGTESFLMAHPTGWVTTQSDDLAHRLRVQFRHSNVYTNIKTQKELYNLGDVMVLPRRYGGNCMPLNEALAAGMPVIMPDISPNNHLLPKEWLVPAKIINSFTPRTKIDIYEVDINALAEKIAWFQNTDMTVQSEKANQIAETISWTVMKNKYIQALESLL